MPHNHLIRSHTTSRPKRRLSIRARLIFVALLAVVPLMLDRVRFLEATRAEKIEAAYTEAIALAKRGADAQIETINSTKALLEVVASAFVKIAATDRDCVGTLTGFASDVPWIKALSVVGPNDRIICSTRPSAIGLNLSDRQYVAAARRTRGFVLSDYIVSRSFGQPAVIAAYSTLSKNDQLDDVILAPLDLDWVGRLADTIENRPGASAFVIDGTGTVLAGVFNREDIVGHDFRDNPLIKEILTRDRGSTINVGLDGVRRIFAFLRLPDADARLVVGFEEREVLSHIDRQIGIAYIELLLFGFLALFATWIGGEKLIVQPIRALARTAARIGRGELDVRCRRENWAAEFAPLAVALDDMAAKLASRERELLTSNLELAELAAIDSLSGLANRRSFDARLAAEWQRAQTLERPMALLMIDVDHFKLFNDCYGHVEGDNCLRLVGEILTSAVDNDGVFAARYGGEEFVILLRDALRDRALQFAERLRSAVAERRIPNAPAPTGHITVSIGVASLLPNADDAAQSLIEAADASLYEAKRRGRNIVVLAAAEFSQAC